METNNLNRIQEYCGDGRPDNRSGRIMGGLLIVAVGAALLGYQLDLFYLPRWMFSWKLILIIVGLYSGFRHNFRNPGWIFPVIIGSVFLLEDLIPNLSLRQYIWPILLIAGGLWIMLKPRRVRRRKSQLEVMPVDALGVAASREDFINGTAIFGGIKKTMITKSFKGGQITTVFGGAEYNLTHADIQGEVVIDVTMVFGGTSLVIPADWKVRSEVTPIFGGVDEKRAMVQHAQESDKVLVLAGTVIFGGIDIKSY